MLNGLIGAGIYALPSSVAASAGALSPWLFLAVGAGVATIVFGFGQLASYFRETGGPVLYTSAAFGPFVSFQTGWLLYLGRVTAMAANANLLADYAALIWPDLSLPVLRASLIVFVCTALMAANIRGVRQGMLLIGVLTVLKVVPLLALILTGFTHISPGTLFPANAAPISNVGETALLLLYAFIGFEAALVTAGETKSPKTTIPRALLPTVLGTAVLYFLLQAVYVGVQPPLDYASKTPLVELGTLLFGAAGALIITVAAVCSIGGNLASIVVTAPRMTFAMAEEKTLPAWFGAVSAKFATPHYSIAFLCGLALCLALSGSFVWLAAMSSLTRVLAYLVSLAALPIIRRQRGEVALRWRDAYLAVAAALCIWVSAQVSATGWLTMIVFIAVGAGFYFTTRRR